MGDTIYMNSYESYPEMMIISHSQLGVYTAQGWVLVQLIGNVLPDTYQACLSGYVQPNTNNYQQGSISGSIGIPTVRMELQCLIGRKEHVVIDALRAQLDQCAKTLIGVAEKTSADEKVIKNLEGHLKSHAHERDNLSKRTMALETERNALIDSSRKMEKDLGKLREEFGSAKVKEVLGY